MNDVELSLGESAESARRLVPMKIGESVMWIESLDDAPAVVETEEAYLVARRPEDAFETASKALQECVRVVGEHLQSMGQALQPQEVGVEFTVTFDVEGSAAIIPVLLTGKAKSGMGIKVTAKWLPGRQSGV